MDQTTDQNLIRTSCVNIELYSTMDIDITFKVNYVNLLMIESVNLLAI